jgi:multiple sugar transport system permease protein
MARVGRACSHHPGSWTAEAGPAPGDAGISGELTVDNAAPRSVASDQSAATGYARPRATIRWQSILVPYLYLLPFIVLFIVFRVFPLVYGLYLSLTNLRLGPNAGAFVGVANYTGLLADSRFQHSLLNTGEFTLEASIPVLGLPLILAVLLNREVAFRTYLRSAFFFPFTLSVVTLGLIWGWLLDPLVGPFNFYLRWLGAHPPSWLGDPATALSAIVMTTVWWVTGYYLVIYLAALQDIPRHLYEAAAIDGAGRWQAFWSITMPLLRPIFLFVIVVHIIGAFQIFGQVFVLTNGGPADSTRTVVQHIYETGFTQQFLQGPAAAMSWVLFILILVFSILQFRLLRGHAEY